MAPTLLEQLENIAGSLFSSFKERDAGLLPKSAPFADFPTSTITVTSPELGQINAHLTIDHTPLGANRFPALSWTWNGSIATPAEYIVVVEDPDAPLPTPVVHGIYYGIQASKTSILPEDLIVADVDDAMTAGGFHYGANRMQSVFGGAKPPIGHGVHRYFFQVVALSEPLAVDQDALHGSKLTRAELVKRIQGKVLGWGEWVATYERTLPK